MPQGRLSSCGRAELQGREQQLRARDRRRDWSLWDRVGDLVHGGRRTIDRDSGADKPWECRILVTNKVLRCRGQGQTSVQPVNGVNRTSLDTDQLLDSPCISCP